MSAKDTGGSAVDVADIFTRDCGYGFSGHAVMNDGTRGFYTTRLHATREQAAEEVTAMLAARSTEAK